MHALLQRNVVLDIVYYFGDWMSVYVYACMGGCHVVDILSVRQTKEMTIKLNCTTVTLVQLKVRTLSKPSLLGI